MPSEASSLQMSHVFLEKQFVDKNEQHDDVE